MKSLIPILCLFTFACDAMQSTQQIEKELNQLYASEFKSDEPGGSILVKKGEEVSFIGNYGVEDLETGKKITEYTIFNTGSISKTFVSNGILILQERGLISVDDKLSKYFDDFEDSSIADKIRIKHLLSHTSGLPDLRNVSENREFFLTAKDTANFEPLKQVATLNFEPGEKFQYSNPAYNGLALIIEKLSNQPWQQFITDNIFTPAGMIASKITDGPHPESGVAHAYVKHDGHFIESDYGEVPTFAASGNGGVWSSVLELAKYETSIREAVFLSEELIRESRTVYRPKSWTDSNDPFVGYSWFTGEESLFDNSSNLGVDLIYHTGSQGGFRAFYISIPEKNILFVGLFNRPVDDFRKLMQESLKIIKKHNWL